MTSRRRGAAAVEMAVTMVLLVPLILYTLFLEDLLYYRMENQEPTIVAGFDYTTSDYMKNDIKGVQHLNRLKYCDHTAAFDSYNADYDCNGTVAQTVGPGESEDDDAINTTTGGADRGHHQATGAHQCWIAKPDAHQVTCSLNKNGASTLMTFQQGADYGRSDWNKGGIATCTARLGVMNYMLPVQFMEWFGGKKSGNGGDPRDRVGAITNKKRLRANMDFKDIDNLSDKDVHDDGAHAGENTWFLREEQYSILTDSWALTDMDPVKPTDFWMTPTSGPSWNNKAPGNMPKTTNTMQPGSVAGQDLFHPLLDRSAFYYNSYAQNAVGGAQTWRSDVNDFLSDDVEMDGLGDDVNTMPVRYDKAMQRAGNGGFASGWQDQRQQNLNRENTYPSAWGP